MGKWMKSWIPGELRGGPAGRSAVTATSPVLTTIAKGLLVHLAVQLLQRLGLPNAIARPILHMYDYMSRICCVNDATSDAFKPSLASYKDAT